MPQTDPAVQVEAVIRIERELAEARKRAAHAIRESRESQGIGLRTAAKAIRLSPAALSELEVESLLETTVSIAIALRRQFALGLLSSSFVRSAT